jgi:hypothetical protein
MPQPRTAGLGPYLWSRQSETPLAARQRLVDGPYSLSAPMVSSNPASRPYLTSRRRGLMSRVITWASAVRDAIPVRSVLKDTEDLVATVSSAKA